MTDEDRTHGWNHRQCMPCWIKDWGLHRIPVRVQEPDPPISQCCFCGRETGSGIFRRVKPGFRTIPYCPDSMGSIYRDGDAPSPLRSRSQPTDFPDSRAPSSPPEA